MSSSQLSLESIMRVCGAGAKRGLVARRAVGEPGAGVPLRAGDSGISLSGFNPDGSLMEPVKLQGATRRPKLTEAVQRDYENDGVSAVRKVAASDKPLEALQWLGRKAVDLPKNLIKDNFRQTVRWPGNVWDLIRGRPQDVDPEESSITGIRPGIHTIDKLTGRGILEVVRSLERKRLEREMDPGTGGPGQPTPGWNRLTGGRNKAPTAYDIQRGQESRARRKLEKGKLEKGKPMGRTGWGPVVTGGIVISMLGLVGGSALHGRSQARKKLEAIRASGGSGDTVAESLRRMDRARDESLRRQGDGESR